MIIQLPSLMSIDPERMRPDAQNDPRQLERIAAEFESLLLAQLLRSMRDSAGGGWLGEAEDQAGSHMVEIAEQHLARALAGAGGLGLGPLVVSGLLAPNPNKEPPQQ